MSAEIAYYYALWRMHQLPPEEVPRIACDALESGLDSPALRYLAGLERPTSREIGSALDDACSQLGILPAPASVVEKRESDTWIWDATQIAKHISAQILNGTLDAAEGWLRLPYREGDLGPLAVFFEFAEREGPVRFDEHFRSKLIEAAKQFQSTTK